MDETNNSLQTIRFNIPPKKTADVTIDLRQNSLVHLFTVDNVENTGHINSSKCTNTEQFFRRPPLDTNNYEETSCSSDAKEDEKDFCSVQNPSTIIHVKIIPSSSTNGNKVIEDGIQSSSSSDFVCDQKDSPSVSHKCEDSLNLNKNCLKVRMTLHEMQKELKNIDGGKQSDERTSILKEFEISKQLERLRSESKKISRRKYHTSTERPSSSAKIHSPKSEFSEVSSNDISSIFNDADDLKMVEDVISKHMETYEVVITSDKLIEPVNGGKVMNTGIFVEVPQESLKASSLRHKRKNTFSLGPRSKKMKMLKKNLRHESASSNRKQVTFTCPSHQFYFDGMHIFKDCNNHFTKEDICLFVNNMHSDEDYAQIGCEVLELWKLNASEINELKNQVKEEFKHKQEEHIMPLILGLSSDQIESTYEEVKDIMKMYDITEQDSDEDLISNGEEEDDDDDGEFKSLDTLYKEEFSKQCYKELFDSSDFQPWKTQEEQNDVKTDYSRSRPKRSSVDYSPSAYAFISFMEGRRASHRGSYDGRQHVPESSSKVKNQTKAFLSLEKASNGRSFNVTSRHGKFSGSKSSDDAGECSYEEIVCDENWVDGVQKHSDLTIDASTRVGHTSTIDEKESIYGENNGESANNEEVANNGNSKELDSGIQTIVERSEHQVNFSNDVTDPNELNIYVENAKISSIPCHNERKKTNPLPNVLARPNSAPPNIGIEKQEWALNPLQSVFHNKVDDTPTIISLKS